VRLMIFNAVGLILAVIAYAFGLGGTLAALVYLFVLFNGVLDRWAQPMLARLRP
jgi:ABC-type nickel/cobalt efflux system permease component RcnA